MTTKAQTNDRIRALIVHNLKEIPPGDDLSIEGLTERIIRQYPRQALINTRRIGVLLREFQSPGTDQNGNQTPVVKRIGYEKGQGFGRGNSPVIWQRVA